MSGLPPPPPSAGSDPPSSPAAAPAPRGAERRADPAPADIPPAGKVSVVIPAYNAAGYLPDCIESVLAQTYRDTEIIVVDDGSTDDTAAVLDGYSSSSVRVVSKENGGTASAINAGIEAMTGEWFKTVGADDIIYPNCLADLMRASASLGPDSRVIPAMSIRIVYLDGTDWMSGYDCNHMTTFEQGVRQLDHFIAGNAESIYHRSVFERVGTLDTSLRFAEDYDHTLRLMLVHKYRFWRIPRPAYEYRIRHASQSSVSPQFAQRAMDAVRRSILDALPAGERSRYASALARYRRNREFVRGVFDRANGSLAPPPGASHAGLARRAAARLIRSSPYAHALYRGALRARRAKSMRYLAGWMWAGRHPDAWLASRCRGLHPNSLNEVTPLFGPWSHDSRVAGGPAAAAAA